MARAGALGTAPSAWTRTEEIEQLGQVMPHRFTMRGDHPPQLLGQNTGPTAAEALLAGAGLVDHGAVRRVSWRKRMQKRDET